MAGQQDAAGPAQGDDGSGPDRSQYDRLLISVHQLRCEKVIPISPTRAGPPKATKVEKLKYYK